MTEWFEQEDLFDEPFILQRASNGHVVLVRRMQPGSRGGRIRGVEHSNAIGSLSNVSGEEL